ncbi:tetratricopeptide repeat protein [Helicobacter pylori]|uniref:tetratricopeptide repeat protein n=1 Tax=Helicobacter pylori TaxID=210 RepID=UPI0002BBDE78|nr:tetratricopeptide repeat protein [Helicobacter pylori]EMH00182.1 tetratricopeptide repeat protein [Helicobacter pylori GAM231Ai]EMJ40018.1 tetratricopeptide repeat protein [Helicobacter pylori GAMchJs117Ai]
MPLETITLARIYEEQGFFEEALQIYTNILKKTPDHTEALKQIKRLEKIQKNLTPFKHDALLKQHYLNFIKGDFLSVENLEQWLVEWN